MKQREAYIEALRIVASMALNAPGGGLQPTENEDDDEKVFRQMEKIAQQLDNRADRLGGKTKEAFLDEQANLALKTKMPW